MRVLVLTLSMLVAGVLVATVVAAASAADPSSAAGSGALCDAPTLRASASAAATGAATEGAPAPAAAAPTQAASARGAASANLSGQAPQAAAANEPPTPQLTPLLVEPLSRPVPVRGADGRTHLLYELLLTNATSGDVTLRGVTVHDASAADAPPLATFDAARAATMLQPLGTRSASARLGNAQAGVLFVALALDGSVAVPASLTHELALDAEAVPGGSDFRERAGVVEVDRTRVVPVLGPPLEAGEGYLPADGCCTAVRHIRAGLPIDGRLVYAQRFAIDWEQIDGTRRFVNGDPKDPASYTIHGKQVIAAGDGKVVSVVDGLPEQVPGALPQGIGIAQADGNAVVQDLGDGAYALYAHMQPGSIRVKVGDVLRRGDAIGLVGNSGNSSAPHLHFHVMDGPSPLGASGLPYVLESFTVTGGYPSTEVFDAVENTTEPLPVTTLPTPQQHTRALPLDLSVVTLP